MEGHDSAAAGKLAGKTVSTISPASLLLAPRTAHVGGLSLLLAAVALVLAACGEATSEGPGIGDDPSPATTSASAGEDGGSSDWIVLFDGETLEGWRGYRLEGVPAGWSVADGAIHLGRSDEGQRADLMTEAQFASFDLELEWAVGEGGNSGIFFHVTEDHDRSYETGPEYQILDNGGHRDGEKAKTSAASNYALHEPAKDVTLPLREFNVARLVVQGDHVEHWLNGEKVLEYTLWDDDWKARVAASKFAAMPDYGLRETGHVVLQDHGDEIWFRNIRIKRLDF